MTERSVLYLVRHGRTRLNADGLIRGHLDEPLDEEGLEGAARLGDAFRNVPLRLIASSPLGRTMQTAQPIALAASLDVIADDRLIDRDYGAFAGKPVAAVIERYGSLDDAPGVEPIKDMSARLTGAVEDLIDRSAGAPLLLAGHDATNRLLLAELDPALGDRDLIPQRPVCWNRLERDADGWHAVVVDALPGEAPRP